MVLKISEEFGFKDDGKKIVQIINEKSLKARKTKKSVNKN